MVFGTEHVDVKLNVWHRVILTMIVMLFMVHMSVTKASLQLMTCRPLGQLGSDAARLDGTVMGSVASDGCSVEEARSRVAGDLELCCTDPTVQSFRLGLGIPSMLVYAFGIPVTAGLVLWWNQKNLEQKRVRATLGFLYAGYRKETYYWETVVMIRKALVATIAVFLAPMGAAIQTYAAILLMVGLIVLQLVYKPFRAEILNRLELGSLLSAFVTFECGLFLTDPNSSELVLVLATMGAFVVNVVTTLAIVGVVMSSSKAATGMWSRTMSWTERLRMACCRNEFSKTELGALASKMPSAVSSFRDGASGSAVTTLVETGFGKVNRPAQRRRIRVRKENKLQHETLN